MTIYVPPALRVPSYTVPGPHPVVLRLGRLGDEDLVDAAYKADAVAVVAPGLQHVSEAGRWLGDFLAAVQSDMAEPEFQDFQGSRFELTLTPLHLELEDAEGRVVLTATHSFADFGGLSVLVVVLAPDHVDEATIRLPLDPQTLF